MGESSQCSLQRSGFRFPPEDARAGLSDTKEGWHAASPLLCLPLCRVGLETGGRLCAHLAEAVAAVNGTVTPGPEWHHCIVPALGAVDGIHLSGAVLIHACRPLLRAAHCPTAAAAFGFVTEPPGLEKFLFARSKNKFSATLDAIKSPV